MEDYIVSARKYRPSTFRDVVGQKSLTTTLKNAIQTGKLAHAYLFCGPRGVGKTSCARIFAKTINCQNRTSEGEACNECESCRSFNEQRSLNIRELDAASNNSVDDIRLLTEEVRVGVQIGKYKVFIIDEVHMLSTQAFNAFLKTLEEPPAHAIFILATTEKQKILPTILSRCQTYDFARITVDDIVEHLQYVAAQENITAETEGLNVIAQKADGGMRDALSIFDQVASYTNGNITYQSVIENLNVLDYEYYFRMTDAALGGDVRACLLTLNEILSKGFDGQNVITGLASHFRDLLVCKDEATLVLFEAGSAVRDRYKMMAQRCPDTLLFDAIDIANRCDLDYRNSRNKRLLLELTLIQICQLTSNSSSSDEAKKKTLIKPLDGSEPASAPVPAASAPQPPAQSPAQPKPAAPVAAPQPQQPVVRRSTSIKELMKAGAAETTDVKSPDNKPVSNKNAGKNFTQEELIKFWIAYAESLSAAKEHLKNTLLNCQPVLKGDLTLEVAVYNPIQNDELTDCSAELLSFLRKNLNNEHIKMQIIITEKEEQDIIYTATDKYKYLADKYPSLEKLRETFDLTLV